MDKYQKENGRRYRKYGFTSKLLCIGDRMRGSVFRPCLDVLPATTLEGALRDRFPRPDRCVYAIGRFTKMQKDSLVYSPRDRVAGVSKVPIQTEVLADVEAEVYILLNDWTVEYPKQFSMRMGAMRAQGCGWTEWETVEDEIPAGEPVRGTLYSRIPDSPKWREAFGIKNVLSQRVGYLPIPERGARTYYHRALFEGSVVCGDAAILLPGSEGATPRKHEHHDRMASVLAKIASVVATTDAGKSGDKVGSILATAGAVLARYGYAVARLHLEEKTKLQQKSKDWVDAALKALEVLEGCEPTRSNPELAAFVLKKLHLVARWQQRFGNQVPVCIPADPLPDAYGEAFKNVEDGVRNSDQYKKPKTNIKRNFATEVANAVARFGVDGALDRLEKKEQSWAQQRQQNKPIKGQPKENVALARRILEEMRKEERIVMTPNVGRILIRRLLAEPRGSHS